MSNFENGEFDENCDKGHWGCTKPEHADPRPNEEETIAGMPMPDEQDQQNEDN